MLKEESQFPYPQSVLTIDDLVTALEEDPLCLPMLQGVNESVLDRRKYSSDPFFTLESMSDRFQVLLPFADSSPTLRGPETHFGKQYIARKRSLTRHNVEIAKRINYMGMDHKLDGIFYPEQTIRLFGLAPEKNLRTISVELTRYRTIYAKKVNIYKIMQSEANSIRNNLRNLFTMDSRQFFIDNLLRAPRKFTRTQVVVGAPSWSEDYAQLLAWNFGLESE